MKYNVTVETEASGAVLTVDAASEQEAHDNALAQANVDSTAVFTVSKVELADEQ